MFRLLEHRIRFLFSVFRFPTSGSRNLFSVFRFPFCDIRKTESVFRFSISPFPFSGIRHPENGIRFPFSVVRFPFFRFRYPPAFKCLRRRRDQHQKAKEHGSKCKFNSPCAVFRFSFSVSRTYSKKQETKIKKRASVFRFLFPPRPGGEVLVFD